MEFFRGVQYGDLSVVCGLNQPGVGDPEQGRCWLRKMVLSAWRMNSPVVRNQKTCPPKAVRKPMWPTGVQPNLPLRPGSPQKAWTWTLIMGSGPSHPCAPMALKNQGLFGGSGKKPALTNLRIVRFQSASSRAGSLRSQWVERQRIHSFDLF